MKLTFASCSLQATWIRNTILNALEKTAVVDPRTVPGSFIYHHPTIASLAAYVFDIANGTSEQPRAGAGAADAYTKKIDAMHAMLRKYGSDFRKHVASPSRWGEGREGEVILLTGTTGWLGSLILAELVQDPNVKRVYALNRKVAAGSTRERQIRAFEEKGIDGKIASSNKVVLLDADLATDGFGLDGMVFNEVNHLHLLLR